MSAGNPDRARRDRKAVDYTLTAFDKEMQHADKEMIARAKRGREEAADAMVSGQHEATPTTTDQSISLSYKINRDRL